MDDIPVTAPSNAPANHSETSQQPPSDGAEGDDAEQNDLPETLRPPVPLLCCTYKDDEDEDDERGVFDYISTSKHVAAVEALGKPKVVSEMQCQNDVTFGGTFKVESDTASSNDSPRLDDMSVLGDATRRVGEYELGPIDHGLFKTHLPSSRYKTTEDISNAKIRANNDRQYDEQFLVCSASSSGNSDDDPDDNLVGVSVHERLINRDTCYVQMNTNFGDDSMECINQAKTMSIHQPLNSFSSQNYGSTSAHSHAGDTAAGSATSYNRDSVAAMEALPTDRMCVEKSMYGNQCSPPFGDPVRPTKLIQSVLQLYPSAESSGIKKKKKKKKPSKGDESGDNMSQRDINGNPVGAGTKKQHSSGKTADIRSLEPHSRSDSGYELSDLSQNQMSSSSDSRYQDRKAKKKAKRLKIDNDMQAKDIPGNRGTEEIDILVNYINNGEKKQRQNGQVNGIPQLGGATEQKASFSAKKPACGKNERKVSETDGKGQSGGSEGKMSDMYTGSEGSSVSDSVTNMSSILDTTSTKDVSLVFPSCNDTYIFTDFDIQLPKDGEFTEVKKKKKRPKDSATVTQKDSVLHALCQMEPHRKSHVSTHSVTPPPTSSVGSDDAHVERALSPSSFPVLGRSREGRRNSTGNAPPVDGMQDDSDMESVKSVPIGSELSGRLDGGLSPSNLAKQSYAKIAAAQRPGKDGSALYRAEQTHLTGADGHPASVKYAKDVERDRAVMASVERVEPLGVQNTKQIAACDPVVAVPQTSLVVSSVDAGPLIDNVRTLVTPEGSITVTKKTAHSALTQVDVMSTVQPLVCCQSSTQGVLLNEDSSSPNVSGLESFPRTRSDPSVCAGPHGSSVELKTSLIRSSGSEDESHLGIPEFSATEVVSHSVCPENAPSHAVPPSDKQNIVAKETQYSNETVSHPLTCAGATVGDVSVSIVNTNVESGKMLSPQNNSGLTPAAHVATPTGASSCSRAAAIAPKASNTTKRSKTNQSVIFFDKKLNELPQNLDISFGFEPETISVNDITKSDDAHHGGGSSDACVRENAMTDAVQQQQPPPPRDSSLSLVADTMPSPPTPRGDAADVYRAKVLAPMNGVILPHTAGTHQGATPGLALSSVLQVCPEHVHLVSDSSTLYAVKPSSMHGSAGPLYNRANDFNFQRGKFDVEGAVTFLYKEWEKVTRIKRTSRVIFYRDNQHN